MQKDIAIIGIAFQFGSISTLKQYHHILKHAKDDIREIPKNRLEKLACLSKYDSDIRLSQVERCAYIENIDYFDNDFFGISPKEAQLMDPHQRFVLQEMVQAFQDAGYTMEQISHSKTGIFIGCSAETEYKRITEMVSGLHSYNSVLGNCMAMIPGRAAYTFNTNGPAILINTVCSSSLVATFYACESIRAGQSDMAVAAGIELRVLPYRKITSGIESKDQITRSYDSKSTGTGTGEGVGILILKEYEKAKNDRDHIYCVIKGGSVNHCGHSISLTAPNSPSQKRMLIEAWENAGVDPECVSYIEGHGTGTPIGDPIELAGIDQAFKKYTTKKRFCAVSSVKSNLGHLDAAAGMAGIIKAILSFRKKRLYPSAHFESLNKNICLEESAIYINNRYQSWTPIKGRYICGVSAIGFCGTNCHIVLEDVNVPANEKHCDDINMDGFLFVISAKSQASLQELLHSYSVFLMENPDISLRDLCCTLSLNRDHFPYRFACVIRSKRELEYFLQNPQEAARLLDAHPASKWSAAGRRYLAQEPIDWDSLYDVWRNCYRKIPTVRYPFEKKSFWIIPTVEQEKAETIHEAVRQIIENAIGDDSLDIDQSFESCGGSSLTAIEIADALLKKLKIASNYIDLMTSPSIRLFIERICAVKNEDSSAIKHNETVCEISQQQLPVILANKFSPNTDGQVIVHAVALPEFARLDKSSEILKTIINRHEALRTAISAQTTGFRQIIHSDFIPSIEYVQLSCIEEIYAIIDKWAKIFEVEKLPLIHFVAAQLGSQKYLFIIAHRVICDGYSLHVIALEYQALMEKKPIAQNCISYREGLDLIKPDSALLREYIKKYPYYESAAHLPYSSLTGQPKCSHQARNQKIILTEAMFHRLESMKKENGYSIPIVILAVLLRIMKSWINRSAYMIGLTFLNRPDARLINSVGPYANTLPFLYKFTDSDTICQQVTSVKRQYQDLSQVQSCSANDFGQAYGYMLNMDTILNISYLEEEENPCCCVQQHSMIERNKIKNALTVDFYIKHSSAEIMIVYDDGLYGDAFIRKILNQFEEEISNVLNAISEIDKIR